jgi:hypothetical protein
MPSWLPPLLRMPRPLRVLPVGVVRPSLSRGSWMVATVLT